MHGLKKLIRSYDSNSVTHVHFTMLHNVGQLMVDQTVHFWPDGGNAWVNLARTWPEPCTEICKPCTDGSFPLIVVKHTRQVVRIEVMRADLLGRRDVDGDFWFFDMGI